MSKVRAVAATIVFMLGASVAHAQGYYPSAGDQERNRDAAGVINQSPVGQAALQGLYTSSGIPAVTQYVPGMMYVARWAEVPSHNAAYFTAPFLSPTVNSARKEFRQLVTRQYGQVGRLQCAGKFNEAVVNEQVAKWKDSARSKNAIVDTDWQPVAAALRGYETSASR
jgi:hypothetical protein